MADESQAVSGLEPEGAGYTGSPAAQLPLDGRLTYRAVKRAFDIVAAAIGLVVLSPVMAIAAVAVKLETPGPVIFRQYRLGQGGRLFTLYKFRGMYSDARERFPEMYRYEYKQDEVQELQFHQARDPRVTRVGGFLRRTSVDELPNLLNVLIGDMSLVGPRPEIPEMFRYFGVAGPLILSVKPGVTCLAKVTGRDELSFAETLALDLDYVRRAGLKLDLEILLRTIVTVLRQDGMA